MKKIIPSRLETRVQKFLYRTIGERIPARVTPNQITLAGALGGACGHCLCRAVCVGQVVSHRNDLWTCVPSGLR